MNGIDGKFINSPKAVEGLKIAKLEKAGNPRT